MRPDPFCPICGENMGFAHECGKRVLSAIESADTRIRHNEDAYIPLIEPTFSERLDFAEEMKAVREDENRGNLRLSYSILRDE
jgi:hypothetical protein